MAKKTSTSSGPAPSRAKASTTPAAPKAAAPKHRRTKAPAETPAPVAPTFTITHEDIATLAFSYWEQRGYQGGSSDEDWRRAERHLSSLLA